MSNVSLSVLYIQRTIHGIPLSEIVRTLPYQALHLNSLVVLALPGSEVFVTVLTSRVGCMRLFWGVFCLLWLSPFVFFLSSLLALLLVLRTSVGERALPSAPFQYQKKGFLFKILFPVSFCYSKFDLLLPPFAPSHLILVVHHSHSSGRHLLPQNSDLWLTLSLLQVNGRHRSTMLGELTGYTWQF